MFPSSDQITALTGLVAALGSIVTAVLAFMAKRKAAEAHTVATDVRAMIDTGNGHTVGENSTVIAQQVIPGRAAEDAAHDAAAPA